MRSSRKPTDSLAISRGHLSAWPLYCDEHEVLMRPLDHGHWLAYRTKPANHPFGTTHWDANVIDTVFYLLHIELLSANRGKGYGNQLYEIIERIAADIGCTEIRQTPSGWTPRGESRMNYLCRRGWARDGEEVMKRLRPLPSGNRINYISA